MTEISHQTVSPWAGITEGRIVHVRKPGVSHCTPAIVVRYWGGASGAGSSVNVLLFPDGSNDGHEAALSGTRHGAEYALPWMTSVAHESATTEGNPSWHFPERV